VPAEEVAALRAVVAVRVVGVEGDEDALDAAEGPTQGDGPRLPRVGREKEIVHRR
jgi:hypothetical protein